MLTSCISFSVTKEDYPGHKYIGSLRYGALENDLFFFAKSIFAYFFGGKNPVDHTVLPLLFGDPWIHCLALLSYPNFVRGLLFDDIQPLIGRFEILGTLCCTICEVPRRAENQKEAGLRDPWKFRKVTEIERRYFSQSVSFHNFFES